MFSVENGQLMKSIDIVSAVDSIELVKLLHTSISVWKQALVHNPPTRDGDEDRRC